MPRNKTHAGEIQASSMADIAFLLLTFFMVTTVIKDEQGLPLLLPPFQEQPITQRVADRNLYKVLINSSDQLLINGIHRTNLDGVRSEIKSFILNEDKSPTLSDNPTKAIVSLKVDRGTSHARFVQVLDEIQGAYYEIYAERVGLSPEKFRKLNLNDRTDRMLYEAGKKDIPMNISIAEPNRASLE